MTNIDTHNIVYNLPVHDTDHYKSNCHTLLKICNYYNITVHWKQMVLKMIILTDIIFETNRVPSYEEQWQSNKNRRRVAK